MALIVKDRVQETCTSPGTGTVSLLGAVTGFQTFSSAIGNTNTTFYTIADQTGGNWEVGIGTYSTSGNTLARTTVLASSNGGSLTNFSSGTQNIWGDYPAGYAVYASNNPGTSGYYLKSNGSGVAPTWAAFPTDVIYTGTYLVVAGGAGGQGIGGGGGAGGLLTGSLVFVKGTVYTATVGAGAGVNSTSNGSNSSLTTANPYNINLIAFGGGFYQNTGGCGGGGGRGRNSYFECAYGTGAAGQGNNGGFGSYTGGTDGFGVGGGGGGAGTQATGAYGSAASAGGNGILSAITGSNVYYGGGGGGGGFGAAPGTGGLGGGGAGAGANGAAGTSGTANTGGGGGGSGLGGNTGGGGSGVVIISVPTASYSGTVTGSPTVTTSGSNTIITFTGSGTYTA